MAFLASFVKYLLTLIVFALIGVVGAIVGKNWRISKDAKAEQETSEEKQKK